MMETLTQGQQLPDSFGQSVVLTSAQLRLPLATFLEGTPALLVFLRHFGCVGCSLVLEQLLPHFALFESLGFQRVLIGNGDPRHIPGFLQRYGLEGRDLTVVTDPSGQIYRVASLRRSFWGSWGARGIWDFLKAHLAGHLQTGFHGDTLQQGGSLLLDEEGRVLFHYQSQSIGDLTPIDALLQAAYAYKAEEIDAAC